MITNLFRIFEPTTSLFLSLNWLSLFIPFIFIINIYWIIPSRFIYFVLSLFLFLKKDLNNNFLKKNLSSLIFVLNLFWMIVIWNYIGLFPYIFTPSRHLTVTLNLSLIFWLVLIIYGFNNYYENIFRHMIPNGTPLQLTIFMVFIERIRNIIRPITLSVRLAANIIAGHLLISLLSEIPENNNLLFLIIFPVINYLFVLEIAVAIIQRYVFITLSSLYLNEIN